MLNVRNIIWTQENYMGWINVTNNLYDESSSNIYIFIFLDLSTASKDLTTPSFMKQYLLLTHKITMTWLSWLTGNFPITFLGLHPLLDH